MAGCALITHGLAVRKLPTALRVDGWLCANYVRAGCAQVTYGPAVRLYLRSPQRQKGKSLKQEGELNTRSADTPGEDAHT